MPVQSQVVGAGEVGPVSGSVQAVPGEGTSDGSDAMESLNPVLCSNPEATTVAEDPDSVEESCGSDSVAKTLPQTQAATPGDRSSCKTENCCGHPSQAVRSRYGRQQRPPNRYGDWV